ncbi:MAG TPA: SDR family oxidoreductase, partial [Rhodocyclaceae bacterium]|nr:SDR family oxidoreductase [Rhodocyclaceae bacterium]
LQVLHHLLAAGEAVQAGVRVNTVSPGGIDTPMLDRFTGGKNPDSVKWLQSLHPIGRIGVPSEIAKAVAFLLSDDASFVTGHDLLGDGSLIGVPLPGHSHGQLGLFIPDAGGRPAFLVADACWSLPALRDGRLPAFPALLVNAERRRYVDTFRGLTGIARRETAVALLPSHCTVAWREFTPPLSRAAAHPSPPGGGAGGEGMFTPDPDQTRHAP